jgi:hypothetical protein
MNESKNRPYQPLDAAPRNRTIAARHRDGYELRVKWGRRSAAPGNSFWGNAEPKMIEGWCTRENETAVLFSSDLVGWREIADDEE